MRPSYESNEALYGALLRALSDAHLDAVRAQRISAEKSETARRVAARGDDEAMWLQHSADIAALNARVKTRHWCSLHSLVRRERLVYEGRLS